MLRRVLIMSVLFCVVAVSFSAQGADEPNAPPAVITSPRSGTRIDQIDSVEGRVNLREGVPIIFVRAASDSDWWPQPPVDVAAGGVFSGQAHFGTATTPSGTKFHIVVCVARNRDDAEKYKPNTPVKALPPSANYPRSETVIVERK